MANQIILKNSGTSGNVPGSLAYGELAINITDGKLYYRDNNDAVQIIASKSTAGGNATALLNTWTDKAKAHTEEDR